VTQRVARERDGSGRLYHTRQRAEGAGLAGSVGTEQGHDCAAFDLDIESVQRFDLSVRGVQVARFE
jgi:hypothetical protein